MPSDTEWPKRLEHLSWRDGWLTLEAAEPVTLPPYLGSTLRGALGHLLRATLCAGSGCGHECQRPAECLYFALLEQSGSGAKPFILLAPPPPGLEEIALGGPVNLPYRSGPARPGEAIPTLRCEAGYKFDPGATLAFGLRLVGTASNALPAIVEAVARCGLALGGARFVLRSAEDGSGGLIYDRRAPVVAVQMPVLRRFRVEEERASRIRIVFLSPALFKVGQARTFVPEDFAERFLSHSVGRTMQMQQVDSVERLPWVEAPPVAVKLLGQRLFHHDLPRKSYRQDKWFDFDGVVGWMDLAGDFRSAMPWARSAEVLHFGQKSAFGLGKVRVLVLE